MEEKEETCPVTVSGGEASCCLGPRIGVGIGHWTLGRAGDAFKGAEEREGSAGRRAGTRTRTWTWRRAHLQHEVEWRTGRRVARVFCSRQARYAKRVDPSLPISAGRWRNETSGAASVNHRAWRLPMLLKDFATPPSKIPKSKSAKCCTSGRDSDCAPASIHHPPSRPHHAHFHHSRHVTSTTRLASRSPTPRHRPVQFAY